VKDERFAFSWTGTQMSDFSKSLWEGDKWIYVDFSFKGRLGVSMDV